MTLIAAQDSLLVLLLVLVLVLLLPDLVVSTRLLASTLVLTPAEVWSRRATSLLIALPTLPLSTSSMTPTVVQASLPVPPLGLALVP
jgi:hypothetical protein